MGKPYMVEEWELASRVIDVVKKIPDPPTEKFSKSFQEYLNTRLTLDEMMKSNEEVMRLATTKLDERMFYSEEDGCWHKR